MAAKRKTRDNRTVALQDWIAQTDDEILQCRLDRHRFPPLGSKLMHAVKSRGQIILDAPCERGCGTQLKRIIGPDGYVESSRVRYNYDGDRNYLIPPQARSGHGLSREDRALMRLEMIQRAMDRGLVETG